MASSAVYTFVIEAVSKTESARMATRCAGGSSVGPAPQRSASPTAACISTEPLTITSPTAPAYIGRFGFSGVGSR
jgi:hypothetical protein